MNFTQLNTFITVVETGSFQKAAATQYISQRAVSQSIGKLENELGFKLFERGKNKISITSQGQEFFLKTKEILHSFSVEINSLRHEAATTYQELKVGYFSPFEGALLLQKIFDANQKQPELKIKITEESIEHLISDVSLGILDLAFILDYGEQEFLTKNLTNKSIFQSKMVIGVSKLDPLSSGSVFPLTALKEKPILYYGPEKTNYLKHAFLATLPDAYQNLPVARISTIEQMQILVSSNQANAYYPDGLLQPSNSPSEKIEYLPLEGNSSAQNYHVQAIYQKKTEKKKLIQQFLS
ncbi:MULTISPECIES: LysR family transcriptional regulator [Lactobacillus]|uniref:LysR family transcriptional regulator n=1 Tax=Lactobacillus TaxID=1578 RepID=UPI000815C22F|nr:MULTISPECIES: LysR family transcriptional regulator [Lactobacillus]MBH9985546.1 LysR family transcriptional regulator [Lactobacillus sp. M0390]GGG31499.1 LysR family transcriptional regulator [Lactobacillus apis]SCB74658.1 DNA-binding transcriptional regulator, LysR family [Lactobacillus apis]